MKAKRIRYAVVGLGHIAQTAVLPAFAHAKDNSELVALVSGDAQKLRQLGKKYGVKNLFHYDEFEACLESGLIDAVYIATPNVLHQRFAEMAAKHRVHILCEKPLATDEIACEAIIDAAYEYDIKLMVAYRLHFESANLKAIELAKNDLGDLKIFNSTFTMQIRDPSNIRLKRSMGGGTLYDVGIYCINAARYLFQAEPTEVFAMSASSSDPRFKEVDEITSAMLRFPDNRLATFTCSFGAADSANYDVIGSDGRISVKNAYEYAEEMNVELYKNDRRKVFKFEKHDQFAPELLYFSNCILKNKSPEPSGMEGLADVQIITALLESTRSQQPVLVQIHPKEQRLSGRQKINRPAHRRAPKIFHANAPSKV